MVKLARSLPDWSTRQHRAFRLWLLALWLVPWLTQSWADYLRLQILTVAIAGFGYWALTLRRTGSAASASAPKEDAVLDAA